MQEQGGGALTWSVAVHWVSWPWCFLGSAGQGQPPPVFGLEPPCLSYKAIYDGCYLCWTWRVPGKSKLVNLGWLLLVLGLGLTEPAVAHLRGFRKL